MRKADLCNVRPVSPETEAEILDLFETRWTVADPHRATPHNGDSQQPEPYRGPPRPAEVNTQRSYTPPAKRPVSIEELEEYHRKCKDHGITDLEVRNRKPAGPLHRLTDFTIEAAGVVAEMVGAK